MPIISEDDSFGGSIPFDLGFIVGDASLITGTTGPIAVS